MGVWPPAPRHPRDHRAVTRARLLHLLRPARRRRHERVDPEPGRHGHHDLGRRQPGLLRRHGQAVELQLPRHRHRRADPRVRGCHRGQQTARGCGHDRGEHCSPGREFDVHGMASSLEGQANPRTSPPRFHEAPEQRHAQARPRANEISERRAATTALTPAADALARRLSEAGRGPTSRPQAARSAAEAHRAAGGHRLRAVVTPALWPCRKAKLSKHPARPVEHRGQHQPDRQRRRHRPPAAVAEDAGQAAGMSGREQALEKLLRDVDPDQTSRAQQPQRSERKRVTRERAIAHREHGPGRAGTRPPRSRSAGRSTAPPSADTSAPAWPARCLRRCRTPANSEAGARPARRRAPTPPGQATGS